MKKLTTREKLISTIVFLGGDELEHTDDYVKLAMLSDDELVDWVIGIANYYHDELNEQ